MSDPCTTCGQGDFQPGTIELKRVVAGKQFTARTEAQLCQHCSESLVTEQALEAFELAIATKLATGPADGPGFKFMRRVLGLRAVDLAQLLQVSPETISRWENGQRAVDHRGFALLGILVHERASRRNDIMNYLQHLSHSAQEHGFDLGVIDANPLP